MCTTAIQVSESSFCTGGPNGGCPVTVLSQATISVLSTDSKCTADTKIVETGIDFFGAKLGVSASHMVESSHASTEGISATNASTNFLYILTDKNGHVVFFPFYEKHCGLASALRKPNLQDDHDFDCNPDYNILIKHDANVDQIKGVQYNWDGINPGDIYNYETKVSPLQLLSLFIRTFKLTVL